MRTSVRRALCAGAITGGLTVLGIALSTAPASAADNPLDTSGQQGLVSGNQTGLAVHLPVHVSGQQVTVLSHHNTASSGGSSTPAATSRSGSTSGSHGTGSGNQSHAAASVPVDVTGNQVTVIGHDNGTAAPSTSGSSSRSTGSSPAGSTTGRHGTAAGNQSGAAVSAPVRACGNQVTVVGHANGTGCPDGSTASSTSSPTAATTTDGSDGSGSGNQTWLGAMLPIGVEGNQVTVLGHGNAARTTTGGTTGGGTAAGTGTTSPPTSGTASSVAAPGGTTSSGSSASQGAAILAAATLLPNTGAPANLLLWLMLGAILIAAGLILSVGQLDRLAPPRRRGVAHRAILHQH